MRYLSDTTNHDPLIKSPAYCQEVEQSSQSTYSHTLFLDVS